MARLGRGLIASSPLCLASEQTQDLEASVVAQMVKNLPAMQGAWVQSQVGKISWRRKRQPTPVFLLRKIPWIEEPGGLKSVGPQSQTWLSDEHLES